MPENTVELHEVASTQIGNREIIKWNDGSVTIADPLAFYFPEDTSYAFVELSPEQVQGVASFLVK